jgi:hypothetical protein
MQRAVKRHEQKEAHVVPIILYPCRWEMSPIGKLKPLPDNKKPITQWPTEYDGFDNVAAGIAQVVAQLTKEKVLMANLDQLVAAVKAHMQPQPRALATANTLQQLGVFIPDDVTLADLVVGWRTLSRSSNNNEEEIAIAKRRDTCGELATLASQFTTAPGNMEQAIKTWRTWRDAFQKSDDPRQNAMTKTFARELIELQETTI